MNVEIINNNLMLDVYGFSGIAVNKDYRGTAFRLMDKMWKIVKLNNLKHKGLNIWVYELNEEVFAGIKLEEAPKNNTELEQKSVSINKYAYYKHTGPYDLLQKVGRDMTNDLKARGFQPSFPYIEIYGHWTNDETKLETELMISLE